MLVFVVMGVKLYDFQKRLSSIDGAIQNSASQGKPTQSINTPSAVSLSPADKNKISELELKIQRLNQQLSKL